MAERGETTNEKEMRNYWKQRLLSTVQETTCPDDLLCFVQDWGRELFGIRNAKRGLAYARDLVDMMNGVMYLCEGVYYDNESSGGG